MKEAKLDVVDSDFAAFDLVLGRAAPSYAELMSGGPAVEAWLVASALYDRLKAGIVSAPPVPEQVIDRPTVRLRRLTPEDSRCSCVNPFLDGHDDWCEMLAANRQVDPRGQW